MIITTPSPRPTAHAATDDPDAKLDVKDVLHQIVWFKGQNMLPADADGEKMIDKRYAVPLQ